MLKAAEDEWAPAGMLAAVAIGTCCIVCTGAYCGTGACCLANTGACCEENTGACCAERTGACCCCGIGCDIGCEVIMGLPDGTGMGPAACPGLLYMVGLCWLPRGCAVIMGPGIVPNGGLKGI
mmetsp:Transcript_59985/g.107957  ORF Transcript_59985/g.107957 Transcript_59985/m.107957 type:complete len:123 (-) Transcript_59985:267-635(-)